MTDHTPTTDQVRRFWQYASNAWVAGYADDNDVGPLGESHGALFDRWLATHNRKVAAEALREAAGEMRGDGKRVLIDAEESADWLDNYADGFEQGGES